jgi:hypothetical protein
MRWSLAACSSNTHGLYNSYPTNRLSSSIYLHISEIVHTLSYGLMQGGYCNDDTFYINGQNIRLGTYM